MATMKNGLWGGVTGKIGGVVSVSHNGGYYLRSLPGHVRDPQSKKQVTQRSRFTTIQAFLKTFTPFIRVGFQSEALGMRSAFNAAMSYNVRHAVKGETPNFEVDYLNVVVSTGLLPVSPVLLSSVAEGVLHVEWEECSEKRAKKRDQVMLLAYNREKNRAEFDLHAGKRGSLATTLPLPPNWQGDTVETYVAFLSADDLTLVSDSQYAGRHRVE